MEIDMEELLPSEIARLILGFLKETKCEKSWEIFLEECSDLHEYNLLYKRGKLYSTNVNGKSLLNILNEYCTLKNASENISNVIEFSKNVSKEKDILEESIRNTVEQVILKYLPCFCRNSKVVDNLPADVTQKDHTSNHNLDKSIELENETEKMDQSNNTVILQEKDSKGNQDSSGSSVQLKSTDCDSDSSTEEIVNSKKLCIFNGLDDNLQSVEQSVEQSVPDKIYLRDAIKVEIDSESSTFLRHKSRNYNSKNIENSSHTLSNCSESIIQLQLTKNKSVAEESSYKVVSTTSNEKHISAKSCEAMQTNNSELPQTIKVEPDSSVNSINQTEVSNRSQSNSAVTSAVDNQNYLVAHNEPAFCNIQSTRGSVNNMPTNPINLVSSQPGYTIHPFASQPLPVSNVSYSPLPTYFVQNCPSNSSLLPNNSQYFQNCPSNSSLLSNNPQYSIIINAPATGTAATLPVGVPGLLPNNIGPTVTSVTSLSSHNLPPVSINSSPNINAADSTNSCGTSQTDSTAVLNSVCDAAKVVLVSSAGKNNESKSEILARKSGQTRDTFSRKKPKRSCTANKNYCEF